MTPDMFDRQMPCIRIRRNTTTPQRKRDKGRLDAANR
jgi:hypothetical protein